MHTAVQFSSRMELQPKLGIATKRTNRYILQVFPPSFIEFHFAGKEKRMKMFFSSLLQPNSILQHPVNYYILNVLYVIGLFVVLNELVRYVQLFEVINMERLILYAILVSLLQTISDYYKAKKRQSTTNPL